MRVLFTSVPLSGHLFPLVPLAWACRSLGHEVLVSTAENFVPDVVRSGLPATPSGPAADFVALTSSDGIPDDLAQRRYANGRAFGRIAAGGLAGNLALVERWRPDVVVSERAEFAGPIAAAAYGVPHVELQWSVAPLAEYRTAASAELARELARLGLATLPRPAEVLNPWPPGLRLLHAAGHRALRNVPYNGPARVPEWVWSPRRRPRICLTVGTVLPRLDAGGMSGILLPLLERLAALGVELVIAVDDDVAAAWPPLPAAVRHVGRMPLSQVLAVCDAAIHHGGHGTTLTAFGAGNAQLVLPVFDDQLDNAEAVVRSGAGRCLRPDAITPAAVADACAQLLDDARFGSAATRVAAEIAAQPSLVEVVDLLEELAAGGPARALRVGA